MGAYRILRRSDKPDACWLIEPVEPCMTEQQAYAAIGRLAVGESRAGPVYSRWAVLFDGAAAGHAQDPERPSARVCPCACCEDDDDDA